MTSSSPSPGCAEECGFDAFFRSDHYLRMGGGDPRPGPTDAWITLAGLARDTTRIRLGTLLTAATFRLPGRLAVIVAQVDAMSGGRVELGLGAGWFDEEHQAFGIPFPASIGERFDRLEEQLEIVTGLWATPEGGRFSFSGAHYKPRRQPWAAQAGADPDDRRSSSAETAPGGHRPWRLASPTSCNVPFCFLLSIALRSFAELDAACERIGRDPATVRRSAALVVCAGRDEEEIARRRAAAIGREVDELRQERRRRYGSRSRRKTEVLSCDRRHPHLSSGPRSRRPRPPSIHRRGGHTAPRGVISNATKEAPDG